MNTSIPPRFDTITRLLHWSMALLLIGQIGLGFYATSLTYYDPWYHLAPFWHRSLGVVMFALLWLRIVWRLRQPTLPWPETMPGWERLAARINHWSLYVGLFLLPVSGYLVSTADGRNVDVFGWFKLPALLPAAKGRETWMGHIHLILTLFLCALIALHIAAVMKHRFIDQDNIFERML